MPATALAPTSAFVFASHRVQPVMLALTCLIVGQLLGAVASCTPETMPQMGLAGRVSLVR